ncbi:flagellar biosynthetic protein FliR [bacterium]|nr:MULTISPECIES: flagellar biosynthetic protein FliR [Pirellulaceae]MDB4338591.1 flagellar biosynthetic protein FliR [Rubripirellula sp.]MDB4678931.1 flagellar biosynthetic protein FliR [Rhodopirellula sp.]MDC0279083.1 flagellar biosynthetic protein FliR [bacterium]
MDVITTWLEGHLVLGLLVLSRLTALLLAMSTINVGLPNRLKVLFAVALTAMILPSVADHHGGIGLPEVNSFMSLIILMVKEAIIGLLIGSTVQLIVTGVQLGGEVIANASGMQIGASAGSSGSESLPYVAQLVGLIVTAVMLIVGGHRLLLGLLLDSFTRIPLGDVIFHHSMLDLVVEQLTAGMTAGIRVAAPIVAVVMLSNLITGLVSRTLPQINVLAVGLSVNALATFVVLAITIGSAGWLFQEELNQVALKLNQTW